MLSALGPIQKAGWGAVRFRPDTKSGEGGVCVCCTLQAQFERLDGGGGLLSG